MSEFRPDKRQSSPGKADAQTKARQGNEKAKKALINAICAGCNDPKVAARVRRAADNQHLGPQELMAAGQALLVALLSDPNTFMDTKARLGAQLLAEQRKVLEKWKLADLEPAAIGVEEMPAEKAEAAEDDLEA
jgi:hypothetical protein